MSRLIFVPQFPSKLRYQQFWYTEFPKQFKKYFDEVIVLGKSYIDNCIDTKSEKHMFSPIQQSINMEMEQIKEFYDMKLYEDDTLFLSDLSFPGFFCNVLHHKPIKNSYCFCHATSLNLLDYFEPVRESKWKVETGHSKLFKKVFVGSKYHQDKLGWNNTKVVGLPIPKHLQTFMEAKIYDIISVARSNNQKIDKSIENQVEIDFGKIVRKECNTWEEYYKFLSQGKILLISSKEDTFNYSSLEAVMNHTIVLAPNGLAFPELLPKEYLYNNYSKLEEKITKILSKPKYEPIGKLLCHDMCEKFYENIAKEMKGE